MQNRQNGRRRRSGNNPVRAMGGQSASRLEVRVRGNAHQLLEKYKQLARDAHQSGDRVSSEYYLQHADHYFRVLNDGRIRQEEVRARRSVFDQFEDDPQEDLAEDQPGGEGSGPTGPAGRNPAERNAPDRGSANRNLAERNAPDRGSADRGFAAPAREARREANAGTGAEAGSESRAVQPKVLELRLSDGEAALSAFGGPIGKSDDTDVRDADDGDRVAVEKPRTRGRPRGRPRKVVAAAEASGKDD